MFRQFVRFLGFFTVLCVLFTIESVEAAGKKVAVVIAISNFQDQRFTELASPNWETQGREVADTFREAGFNTISLFSSEATKDAVEQVFSETIRDTLTEGDILFVYIVTLGIGGDFGTPAVFGHDSQYSFSEPSETWIDISVLGKTLRDSGATTILVTNLTHPGIVENSDHSSSFTLTGPNQEYWLWFVPTAYIVAMGSFGTIPCQWENLGSVITAGLSGQAETSGDRVLTVGELAAYLRVQVLTQAGGCYKFDETGKYDSSVILLELPKLLVTGSGRWRKPVVWSSLGAGVAAGGASLAFYLDGRSAASWHFDGSEPPQGGELDVVEKRYTRDQTWNKVLGVASGCELRN